MGAADASQGNCRATPDVAAVLSMQLPVHGAAHAAVPPNVAAAVASRPAVVIAVTIFLIIFTPFPGCLIAPPDKAATAESTGRPR